MTNKKENLLEQLRGSVQSLEHIQESLDGLTIYDERGYVDTVFFTEVLQSINVLMDVSNRTVNQLGGFLAPNIQVAEAKKKEDSGSKWSVEKILMNCTLESNVLKLPQVQFNKKSYGEAKKWIEEAGGRWEGGKTQGFIFDFDAQRVFDILHSGKRCNIQQEFQFFETPKEVADWLVMLTGGITSGSRILEPSAGRGAIVKAILRNCPGATIDCYELMPENREILGKVGGVNIRGENFLDEEEGEWDYIVANPPFSGNQDVDHVMHMYEHLAVGGVCAAITSQHWKMGSERKCVEFRDFLQKIGANIIDIDAGEFKESGTGVATTAVVFHRTEVREAKKCQQMKIEFEF